MEFQTFLFLVKISCFLNFEIKPLQETPNVCQIDIEINVENSK